MPAHPSCSMLAIPDSYFRLSKPYPYFFPVLPSAHPYRHCLGPPQICSPIFDFIVSAMYLISTPVSGLSEAPKESDLARPTWASPALLPILLALDSRTQAERKLYVSKSCFSCWAARPNRAAATPSPAGRGFTRVIGSSAQGGELVRARRHDRRGREVSGQGAQWLGALGVAHGLQCARERLASERCGDSAGTMRDQQEARLQYHTKDAECADAGMLPQSQCPSSSQLSCTRFRGTPPLR